MGRARRRRGGMGRRDGGDRWMEVETPGGRREEN